MFSSRVACHATVHAQVSQSLSKEIGTFSFLVDIQTKTCFKRQCVALLINSW